MALHRDRPHSFALALKAARELLSASTELVQKNVIDVESEILVAEAYRKATGKHLSRAELMMRSPDRFPEEAADLLVIMAASRAEGKVLQHITGIQVFLDHEYEVGPDVLVPRPETEVLVTECVRLLEQRKTPPGLGFEIGLGSGIISIELLAKFPALKMKASELTDAARARAVSNAQRILGTHANRLEVVMTSDPLAVWEPFSSLKQKAAFVISNPPYLHASDPIDEEVIRHEPATALFAPPQDPNHFYRRMAEEGAQYLLPQGLALMELAPERAAAILELFLTRGWKGTLLKDLTGRNRVLVATLSGSGY